MAFSEVITSLRSLSANVSDLSAKLNANVSNLTEKMSDMAGQMKTTQWMGPMVVAFGIAVIAIIVTVQ